MDNVIDITKKIKLKLMDEEIKSIVEAALEVDPAVLLEIIEEYLERRKDE